MDRVSVFKNADAWIKYQERFGDPDVFNTMMSHIDSMSKDIALLETFGQIQSTPSRRSRSRHSGLRTMTAARQRLR